LESHFNLCTASLQVTFSVVDSNKGPQVEHPGIGWEQYGNLSGEDVTQRLK